MKIYAIWKPFTQRVTTSNSGMSPHIHTYVLTSHNFKQNILI